MAVSSWVLVPSMERQSMDLYQTCQHVQVGLTLKLLLAVYDCQRVRIQRKYIPNRGGFFTVDTSSRGATLEIPAAMLL